MIDSFMAMIAKMLASMSVSVVYIQFYSLL